MILMALGLELFRDGASTTAALCCQPRPRRLNCWEIATVLQRCGETMARLADGSAITGGAPTHRDTIFDHAAI